MADLTNQVIRFDVSEKISRTVREIHKGAETDCNRFYGYITLEGRRREVKMSRATNY